MTDVHGEIPDRLEFDVCSSQAAFDKVGKTLMPICQ